MATQAEARTKELTVDIDELIDNTIALIPEDKAPGPRAQMAYVRGYNAIWKAWTDDDIRETKKAANKQQTFATDGKDYTDNQYRDILTAVYLMKARMVENEICVFSDKKGNPKIFRQKEYWRRRILETPGLTDFSWTMGEAAASGGGKCARIEATAAWNMHGKRVEIRCTKTPETDGRLTVKMYEKDTADLLIGKAEARLFAKVYHTCTGSLWAAADAMDDAVLEDAIAEATRKTDAEPLLGPCRLEPESTWRQLPMDDKWKRALRSAESAEQVEDVRRDWGEECQDDDERFLRDQACDGRKGEIG